MAANTRTRSGSGGSKSTRSSSGGSSASSRRTSSSRSTASRNGGGSSRSPRSAASRGRSRATKPAEGVKDTLNGATGAVGEAAQTVGNVVKSVAIPVGTAVVGAAAGVVGGVVLGRTKMTRKRKLLGVPMPGTPSRDGMESLAKNVGEAGKQFGKLAGEVRAARQKAEDVGKALK
jgi:hypothetical protein